MSYLEDAVYAFIKRILTSGIKILSNKRFILYTSLAVILPILLTVYSFIQGGSEVTAIYQILYKLELAVCVALVITGLISLKIQLVKIEHTVFLIIAGVLFGLSFTPTEFVTLIEDSFLLISFYSWIITTSIASLMAIRDFMVSWPGWVMRLGDKEDRIAFGPIVKTLVFLSFAWFIYSLWANFSWILLMAFFAGAIILYTIYVFLPVTKDSTMASILSFFYLTLLYHLFVRAESSSGFLIIDISLIVFTTIFTAQGVSNLIASKKHALPYHWDSLIILLLGFMLGYHILGVRIAFFGGLTSLYSLYHDIAFGFGVMTIFAVLLLYAGKKDFRDFSKRKITVGYAARKLSSVGLEAIGNYAKSLKKTLKSREWSFEFKKKKDDEE